MRAERALSRYLWMRAPGARFVYWFSPSVEPHLILADADEAGTARMSRWVARHAGTTDAVSGTGFVDRAARVVFTGAGLGVPFLRDLAGLARTEKRRVPAWASLADAGVVNSARDPDAVIRDDALWRGLLVPSVADTASVLEGLLPGQEAWFWLGAERTSGVPLLMMRTLRADPAQDQLNQLALEAGRRGARRGTSGLCSVDLEGGLRFVSDALDDGTMASLAAWVQEQLPRHPALGRLRDLAFVRTRAGASVAATLRRPELWREVPRSPPPGTVEEAAQVVGALQAGDTAWFVALRAGADGPPLVSALGVGQDPEGAAFRARLRHFSRLFPGAAATCGTIRCLPGETLLLSTGAEGSTAIVAEVVASQGGRHPALGRLDGARLVRLADGAIVGVGAVTP